MAITGAAALAEAFQSRFPVIVLDFRSVDRFLYRIRDLRQLANSLPQDLLDRLRQCHLYMICRRPRLSVVPGSITWTDRIVSLKVSCAVKGVGHEGEMSITRPSQLSNATSFAASPFPHRELIALDKEGKVIDQMLLANFAHFIETLPPFAQQLEVLYIGKGLSDNTQDRLANHETLQHVLADINADDPEAEVFALVFRFDYRRSAGGAVTSEQDAAMSALRAKLKAYQPSMDDQVSLIEASAISYFQTSKYNSHYLSFPANDTDAARRAREAGADYVLVQIDTENIGSVPLYSQHVDPLATHHIAWCIGK